MTSNAGSELISDLFADPETASDAAGLVPALAGPLAKHFRPAFIGRVMVVPYLPLSEATIRDIVILQLDRIRRRIADAYRTNFDYDPAVVDAIASRCRTDATGARAVGSILSRAILPKLSVEIQARRAAREEIGSIALGLYSIGGFTYALNL